MLCNCCCGTRRSIRQALILAAAQLAVAFYIASASSPAEALADVEGDWHGRIDSPAGPMAVVVTLNRDG